MPLFVLRVCLRLALLLVFVLAKARNVQLLRPSQSQPIDYSYLFLPRASTDLVQ